MLGIALGSFMEGFNSGLQTGGYLRDLRKQRKLESGVEGITEKSKAEYDAAVASGEEQPDNFDAFFSNHHVPDIANQYLLAGDPAKATAWTEWASNTTTKKAAKQFGVGLQKLQNGDVDGGIKAMQTAAETGGYGLDGKMTASEYYDEELGKVTGYKLDFTTADGKNYTRNVATEDLSTFFANTINPQAAFEMEQNTKAEQAKADREVDTHLRKKAGEKQYGVGEGAMTEAQYQNAIQEERKRIEESALLDPEVGDMSADEKEALAKQLVDQRLGNASAAPAEPQVAVDPETGEQVQAETPSTDAAQQPAPSDEELAVPSEGEQPTDISPAPGPEAPTSKAPGLSEAAPTAATSSVESSNRDAYVQQASKLIQQGGDGQKIAQSLLAAGIPPDSWPQDVKLAARNAQLGIG